MPTIEQERPIAEFSQAQTQLAGKTVVLSNGITGTVPKVRLDELHSLRLSIGDHGGEWPVSTIKFLEKA